MQNGHNSVILPSPLLEELARHGEQTFPEECCGVLIGTSLNGERTILALMPLANSQGANRERRFLVTPEQYLEAEKKARAENLELLGFYHSHPNHPARPSEFDRDNAMPWFVYIIVSVIDGTSDAMTAWQLDEDRMRFSELALDNAHAELRKH
jgi:proteasome lid subunit RPN8/RPN11